MKPALSELKIGKSRRYVTSKPTEERAKKVVAETPTTGQVQGSRASVAEEYLARALEKHNKSFLFRYKIAAVQGVYGLKGEREVDFLISDGVYKPVQVMDTEFIHHTAQQKQRDYEASIVIDIYFKRYGARPVIWIDTHKLLNEKMAEFEAMKLGLV